jgi:hypothetical protein
VIDGISVRGVRVFGHNARIATGSSPEIRGNVSSG